MIINKNENVITTNIKSKSSQFSIQADEKLFHVLSNLYSDPLGAVIRELSTNCLDAHTLNKYKGPFEIILPTEFKNTIIFRDFGPGLTQQEINLIYTTYGASTKMNSNDFTGCLGLGSKSPFAIVNSFSITSIYKSLDLFNLCSYDISKKYKWYINKKSIYNAYKDSNSIPNIVNIVNGYSNEHSGIAIEISMVDYNIQTIIEKIETQLQHFKVKPIISDETHRIRYVKTKPIHNIAYSSASYNETSKAVMGSIQYDLDLKSILTDNTNIDVVKYVSSIQSANKNIILFANMGDLTFAPSREQLIYDDKTIKSIERIIKNHIDKTISSIIKSINIKASSNKFVLVEYGKIINENSLNIIKSTDVLYVMINTNNQIKNACKLLNNYTDVRIKHNAKALSNIDKIYLFSKHNSSMKLLSNRNVSTYNTKLSNNTKIAFIQSGTRNQSKILRIICKRYQLNNIIAIVSDNYDLVLTKLINETPIDENNFIDTRKLTKLAKTKKSSSSRNKAKRLDITEIISKYAQYKNDDHDESIDNIYYIYCRINAEDKIILKNAEDKEIMSKINDYNWYNYKYYLGDILKDLIPKSTIMYVTNKDDMMKLNKLGAKNACTKSIVNKFNSYITKLLAPYKININGVDRYIHIIGDDEYQLIFNKFLPKAIFNRMHNDSPKSIIRHNIKTINIKSLIDLLFGTHAVLKTIGVNYISLRNINEWVKFFNDIKIDINDLYYRLHSQLDDYSHNTQFNANILLKYKKLKFDDDIIEAVA